MNAPANTNQAAAKPKPQPIIKGLTRPGNDKREIALWPNPDKNLTEEQYNNMSPEQHARLAKQRDLMGVVTVTAPKGEVKVYVSGWIHEEEGQAPRIKLMTDMNAGNSLLGSVRAMTKYRGEPANGNYGLRLIGDLDITLPENDGKMKFTVTGEINGRYPERDMMFDAARVFGFPEAMVEQFAKKVEADSAARARNAVDAAPRRAAAATP